MTTEIIDTEECGSSNAWKLLEHLSPVNVLTVPKYFWNLNGRAFILIFH